MTNDHSRNMARRIAADRAAREEREVAMSVNLKPCPFCGCHPTMEPWHGGGPMKRAISCRSERCGANPMVTGGTPRKTIERWNTRAPDETETPK